jgi:ferric-dicitrate binding protein FerR (iron transport regulator)
MNRELESLWPAAEPPPAFAERVVERALSDPRPLRPPRARRSWSRRAAPVLALVAAMAALFVGWRWRSHDQGTVYAAEPREVMIGERARARLSTGAEIEWSGASVQQARGDVEYRVQRGGPFVVRTPFGTVQVLGTIFRVRVTPAEEQSMKSSKRAIAATGLTAGALLFVAVREGTVRLSNADRQLVLTQGEAGAIGADGIPVPVDPTAQKEPVVAAAPGLREPEGQRRAFDRVRADGVRQRAAGRRVAGSGAALPAKAPAPAPASANAPAAPAAPLTPEQEEHRRVYIRDAVRQQYFPIARSCYEELLGRQPKAAGKVVMSFAIVGDGDAGVVDRVELGDGTTMDDPEFTTCMRESMYSTVFEPPPPGANETTVVYPIELDPGPDDVERHNPGKVEQSSH